MNTCTVPFPKKINMVPAPCASGKTYATCRHIAKQVEHSNWLYVAPSIQLLKETKAELESLGVAVKMITNETHSGSVVKAIIRELSALEPSGTVLLITWASYQNIPFKSRPDCWKVVVDEVPQIDQFFSIDLRQHISELLEYVQLGETVNETTATVIPVDAGKLKRLLNKSDDMTKVLLPLFGAILSENTDVFVDLESWTRLAERRKVSKDEGSTRIYFISMLNPRLFHRATLLGANIEDSMLYRWFNQFHDVEFCIHQRIASNLRFTEHPPMGARLRIQYMLRDQGYSKYLANKQVKDTGYRYSEALDAAALRHIDGRPFLYAVNNDYRGPLQDAPHGEKIPTISHGLNRYQDHNLIYLNLSLNRSPQHLAMLNNLGIDDETIKNSTIHEVVYQAIMRTSLRKPDSGDVVECIVPEYETAARLGSLFGEPEVKWIGDDNFEKVKAMTGSERNRKYRAKQRRERVLPSGDDEALIEITKGTRNQEMALQELLDQTRQGMYAVTFHLTVFDKDKSLFDIELFKPNEFVRYMKLYAADMYEEKSDNLLMNPSIFYSTDSDKGLRRQENFLQSSMMMLDFDNGDLSIDDFIHIFWTQAGRGNKRSFFIFNSFSRSAEQPNRFRVCMLYKQPASTLEAHQAVYDSIVRRLEQNGYTEESAKLDRTCRTGNQSYYMPCTNALQTDWSYFKAYGCTKRDIERYGINPDKYLRTALDENREKTKLVGISGKKSFDATKSIDEWKSEIRNMVCDRHKVMFQFGVALAATFKLCHEQVLEHLNDVAWGNEILKRKIPGIMASLDKRGYWKKVA